MENKFGQVMLRQTSFIVFKWTKLFLCLHRSSSPIPKKSEYHKQRCSHEHHCSDYRKYLKRSTCKMSDKKHGQSNPRVSSHESAHYRCCEHRSPSPDRRSSLDDFYSYKLYQAYSPRRRESSRSQYMSKYSEDVLYQEYCSDYPEQMQGKYTPDDHRVRRIGKGGQSPQRPIADYFRFQEKWHEDNLNYQRMQDEKYSQSLRRGSDDFEGRSSFQTRYRINETWVIWYNASSKKVCLLFKITTLKSFCLKGSKAL